MNVYPDGQAPSLLQQEKAFWASVRGDTFDQLLSFVTFRAAGSRPYGDVFGWYEFARGFFSRQSVPPLIRRLRAAPSPEGKVFC